MSSAVSLYNLGVWIAQVFTLTSIGALLPFVFRVHHPRSNLVYYRVLLVAALLLPLLQPMQHEVVVIRDGPLPAAASLSVSTPAAAPQVSAVADWRNIVLSLLVAGIVIRIGWLAGGLSHLRRFRNSARALYPLPPAVQNACKITRTDALFCISPTIKGPVTFGFLHPVILLPASFLEMPQEAQSSVACHELLHVRRHDWLLTIFEELIASFLWFQPAVWWLVAQSRLAREQLVDGAVVSLAASRESYIQTLVSLADADWEADLGIAPLFLRRRHLIHRVHSLLKEASISRTRLFSSYCSIALILAVVGGNIFAGLPLVGQAEIRRVAAEEEPRPAAQNPPGYVVNRSPLSYPVAAQQMRIEGTVVIELTFNERGEIVDSRVLSGPEELRQAGLQTAVQGKYPIDIARTLQVVIDFKLPAARQRQAGPRGQAASTSAQTGLFGELSGGVVDSSKTPLRGVTMALKNNDDATGRVTIVLTDTKGEYRFSNVPPGMYALSAQLAGFQTFTYRTVPVGRAQQVRLNFTLQWAARR
jgi:beta-lactamase regulating signal transducer with metallopeptidase domain